MNKKQKGYLALLLMVSMILPAPLQAKAADNYIGVANAVVETVTDDVTSPENESTATGAGAFKTEAGNGRIWVDKSVETKGDGSFDVSLSALTQEYISTVSSVNEERAAADVVFVLDGSGSMIEPDVDDGSGTKIARYQAMINAANQAIEIIMKANPENRISLYVYSGKEVYEFLKMGSYHIHGGSNIYLKDTSKDLSFLKALAMGDEVHDSNHNEMTYKNGADEWITFNGGTATQKGTVDGIDAAVQTITKDITDSSKKDERQPYVFLLSDGGATHGTDEWWDKSSIDNPTIGTGSEAEPAGSGWTDQKVDQVTASLILSSTYWKDKLTVAYKDYNEKKDKASSETKFYTVGLGSDINGPSIKYGNQTTNLLKYAWIGLDPSKMQKALRGEAIDEEWRGTLEEPTNIELTKQASNNTIGLLNDYVDKAVAAGITGLDEYKNSEKYAYSDYYEYAKSYAALKKAFEQLANDVASATKVVQAPIEETEIGGESVAIHFKDPLGDNMIVDESKGIGISIKGKTGSVIGKKDTVNSTDTVSIYTFTGMEGKLLINKDTNTVEWSLTGKDLRSCTILLDGSGNYSEGIPEMGVKYNVKLDADAINDSTENIFYTNKVADKDGQPIGMTTAAFVPSGDNSYYYYTNSHVGIKGKLPDLGYEASKNIGHFVKGEETTGKIADGITLRNVYITTGMVLNDDHPEDQKLGKKDIGTLQDITISAAAPKFNEELAKTIYNCVPATDADKTNTTDAVFAFKSGLAKVHNHEVAKNSGILTGNHTQTDKNVSTELFENGTITMTLGNNGRIDMKQKISKTATAEVKKGDKIQYDITVENVTDEDVSGIIVTDEIPAELTEITNKTAAGVTAAYSISGHTVTWSTVEVPKKSEVVLSIEAKVPADATATQYENTAKITQVKNTALANPATSDKAVTNIRNQVSVTVNKDGIEWPEQVPKVVIKDADGNVVSLTNTPNGTYNVFADNKDTGKKVTVTNGVGSIVLDYYALMITKDAGIATAVNGDGTATDVYLKGTQVSLEATLQAGHHFMGWTSKYAGSTLTDADKLSAKVTVNGTTEVKATSAPDTNVSVMVRKDGAEWPGQAQKVVIKDADGNVVSLTNTPDGTYKIFVDDKDTGETVTVTAGAGNIALDYYTLTVAKDSGIATAVIKNGTAPEVYLKGAQVSLEATLQADHHFTGWTSNNAASILTDADKLSAKVTVNGTTEVKATSAPDTNVSVMVRKDGAEWPGQAQKVVIKDADGNVVSLTNTPDGTYKIFVDDKDTGETVTVTAGAGSIALDYYTLTVSKGDGVARVSQNGEELGTETSMGVYLKDAVVIVSAELSSGYENLTWEGARVNGDLINGYTVQVVAKTDLTAKADMITHQVDISATLNGGSSSYNLQGKTITLKDISNNVITDLSNVPDGIYTIYIDNKSTGKTVTVNGQDANVVLNFYELHLDAGVGILKSDVVQSIKEGYSPETNVYIEGSTVTIEVRKVAADYRFANWTGDLTLTEQKSEVHMSKEISLTANAVKKKKVTVEVRLDGIADPTKEVTLVQDGKEPIPSDKFNDVAEGTYKIFIEGRDSGMTVEVKGDASNKVVNYYTLTLEKGMGISSVTGAGVYLEGTEVTINAAVDTGYTFEQWAGNVAAPDQSSTITMNQATTLTASATKNPSEVSVNLKLDGENWTDHGKEISLRTADGRVITNLEEVPDGTYMIYVGGQSTKTSVTVNGSNIDAEINYYTLTLNAQEGISSTYGQGIYLQGSEVNINAAINFGYTFNGWTGDQTIAEAAATITVNGTTTLAAGARQNLSKVTIDINKDGKPWEEHNKTITLKKEDGTEITDLSKVPDGKYIISVDGSSTGKEITVSNKEVKTALNYFTLKLEKGEGIERVTGAGVYLEGTTVKISAAVKSGYGFDQWSGTVKIGTASTEFAMDKAMTLTANAKKITGNNPAGSTPSGGTKKSVGAAQTGDNTSTVPYVIISIAALVLIIVLLIWRKKRNK